MRDGRLVAALASERLTRQKKSGGVPGFVLDAVLETAGVTLDQIDAIALTDWYAPWAHGLLECRAAQEGMTGPDGEPLPVGAAVHDTWDRLWDDEIYRMDVHIRGKILPGYNIGHQKAHSAAAYYTSPFTNAWCMSMDSSGAKPKNNFMVARGSNLKLDWIDTPLCLAGVLYGHVCEQLGIGAQIFKAGSMMALAAYGKVRPDIRTSRHAYRQEALFSFDGDYHTWVDRLWDDLREGQTFTRETSDSPTARDIAATTQFVFEEAIVEAASRIPDDGCTNLCLSGGSFLNCNANSRLHREGRFERVHLFPACTDDGLSVGAALYVAHHLFSEPRARYSPADLMYLGPHHPDPMPDVERLARELAAGKVIGWFQGRSEFGPRALGHRSILADPRNPAMRDRINRGIKRREWYRPLSPSVISSRCAEWFTWEEDSPYMLFTADCPRAEEVPAVVHVDGSARMQTMHARDNFPYRSLIECFRVITGVPMLLNTSLNVDGQPILETIEDARQFWETVPVDLMVVGGEVWER